MTNTVLNKDFTIYLLRHGNTVNNNVSTNGFFNGDEALTTSGIKEADAAAEYIYKSRMSFDTIISSPLKRTFQTASIVADKLGATFLTCPDLREFDPGEWSNDTIGSIVQRYDLIAKKDRPSFRPPGGESWTDIVERMKRAIANNFHEDGNILIIGHAGPMLMLASSLLRRSADSWLDYNQQKNAELWEITTRNETTTLKIHDSYLLT